MSMKKAILFGLITVAFSLELSAQTIPAKAAILLNLDYSRFKYNDQSCYMEIYYSFHPKQLTYNFSDGKYQGGVIISTKIRKSGTDEYVVNEESPLNISEADTNGVWYSFPFVSQAGYAIPNGEYVMDFLASDKLDSSRCDSMQLDLIITTYGSNVAVSDVELCRSIATSDQKNSLYYKNSLEVVPYPSLIFGSSSIPVLYHYVEIYNVDTGVSYTVKTEILDANGASLREKTKERKFTSANSIEAGTTPATAYPSGKYIFRFTLLDENQTVVARTEKTFFIYNPQVQVAQRSFGPSREIFKGMSDRELDREFKLASHIATKDEINMYDQLLTQTGKSEFIFELWLKATKGRGDIPAVSRSEYLEQVKIANERYQTFSTEGWETDRGRVIVVYGEPDQIDRMYNDPGSKPHEIWSYYQIENGVRFVFIDRRGFGKFELVHSTKRGEVMYENWNEFLR